MVQSLRLSLGLPMSPAVASLLPVFMLIVIGAVLRQLRVFADQVWDGVETITYHVFFPAIIIVTLAKANLRSVPLIEVGAGLIGAILIMSASLIALRGTLARVLNVDGPAFTSVFQGCTRWNSFVAIATAGALFGALGLTLTAIAIAAMVPLLNVLAVIVLSRYAQNKPLVLGPTLKALIRNPFIWSTSIGMALSVIALPIPSPVMKVGEILGQAALGAGILLVGAGLDIKAAMRPRLITWVATCLKLAVMPAMAGSIVYALGVSGVPLQVAVLCAGMPSASGAYIIARQMGGDAPLMAEILTVQTLMAMLTLPLVIAAVGG